MAGALERLNSASTSSLRMELMQGLIKMTWDSSREQSARPAPATALSADRSSMSEAVRRMSLLTPTKSQKHGRKLSSESSFKGRDRLDSGESMAWSEVEMDQSSQGDAELRSPGLSTPGKGAGSGGRARGARDIFDIPHSQQVRFFKLPAMYESAVSTVGPQR